MRIVMNLLAGAAGLYMLLIFIRIMLGWFGNVRFGRPVEILGNITDPYLNWWRRFPLRAGFLDLSPILGMAALSLVQTIFSTIAYYGSISLGIMLTIILSSLWSVASFLLGFCIIVLGLRLFAYLTNRNIYGNFWRIVEAIARPVLYRVSRTIFGNRLVNYRTGMIVAIAVLLALLIGGRLAVNLAAALLIKLPV
ncbi:MAG: YggT family protein [Treponema sp.]|jgi:YggT family protein|nr:YggT family protein [Treponema sp.]